MMMSQGANYICWKHSEFQRTRPFVFVYAYILIVTQTTDDKIKYVMHNWQTTTNTMFVWQREKRIRITTLSTMQIKTAYYSIWIEKNMCKDMFSERALMIVWCIIFLGCCCGTHLSLSLSLFLTSCYHSFYLHVFNLSLSLSLTAWNLDWSDW